MTYERNLRIGVDSYTNDELVLSVYGNSSFSGIISATSFNGNFNGSIDISNYSNTSGISTSTVGGIVDVSDAIISGVSTLGFFTDEHLVSQSATLAPNTTYYTLHKNITVGSGATLSIGAGSTIIFDRLNNLDDVKVDSLISVGVITASSFDGNVPYSSVAGIATYSTSAGISTYATSSGIATYATTAGIATYAANSGIATYADYAGIATYATNSGIATNVIGGIASVTSLNVSGIATASEFQTGVIGSAIGINTNTISGPETIFIDPAAVGDNTGLVIIKGDLQVDGTETVINSTTVTVTDKNIQIADGAINDAAADGAGITVNSGDGDKTFQFSDANDSFQANISLDVTSGNVYKINGTEVLSADTLGSSVVNSSLTSVGNLVNLNVSGVSTFQDNVNINGDIDIDNITTTGAGTSTISTLLETAIHTELSVSEYRSVEYTIQATEGTNFHSTKVLVVHDGTTAYHSEYGTIYNNVSVAMFNVDIDGDNLRLLATGSSSNSTIYKIHFVATKI